MPTAITINRKQIAKFCRRHHIRKLSLFGSVLRDDYQPESPESPENNVEFLAEFDPGHVPGFIRLHFIQEELSRLLGDRNVDLVTPKFLNPRIKPRVLAEAEVQYDQR